MALTAALQILGKRYYYEGVPLATQDTEKHVAYRKIRKNSKFGGDDAQFDVQTELPHGSATFSDALDAIDDENYAGFRPTRVRDYCVVNLNGEDIDAIKTPQALETIVELRARRASEEVLNAFELMFHRDGSGVRGVISSGSTVSTTSITLATIQDAIAFRRKIKLQAAATSTGALLNSGAKAQVTGVNRATGVLTFGSALNVLIPSIATGHYLFRAGDGQNAGGSMKVIAGVQQWIQDSPGVLFGVTRSSDPQALAGVVKDYATVLPKEAMKDLLLTIEEVNGKSADTIWMHLRQFLAISNEAEAFVRRTQGEKDLDFGHNSVAVNIHGMDVTAIATPFVPMNEMQALRWSAMELASAGPFPKTLNHAGTTKFVTSTSDDGVQLRVGGYMQTICREPYACGRGTSFGVI